MFFFFGSLSSHSCNGQLTTIRFQLTNIIDPISY